MARRGFGDETWRLAKQGDAAALREAAARLGDDVPYESHRALAFALALERRRDDALDQLNAGWTEEWPVPAHYAVDVARVHYLAGDAALALGALELSLRSSERHDGGRAELAAACVRRQPRLWAPALRLAVAPGSAGQRARLAAVVVAARLRRNP